MVNRSGRKYGSQPTSVDGRRFASKAEARRYGELALLQQAGEIRGLDCQPRFPIEVNGEQVCTVVPDFAYTTKEGVYVVEDVKSPATSKNREYRLKKKLLKAVHGIDLQEVFHANHGRAGRRFR